MNEIYWVLAVCIGVVFCRGFYSEVLRIRKKTFLEWECYRCEQVCPVEVFGFAGYDPFEVVRQVSVRAGISPMELLIVECSLYARILYQGKKAVVVCGELFLRETSEKEFEGVVAHEIGHFVNFKDSLYWYTWYSFAGFFACVTFLCIVSFISFFLGVFVFVSLHFVIMVALAFLGAVLLATICFGVHKILEKKREYGADKKALSLTRYPWDFVNVLSKIAREEDLRAVTKNAIAAEQKKKHGTHPPMRKRIEVAKKILEKRGVK